MSAITDIIGSIPTYHVWRQVGGYNRLKKQYKALIYRRYDGVGDPPSLSNIDGYSSSPISLSTGFSDKDLFDNIAGSKVTIRMLAESIDQLLHIARGDDTKYRVEVIDDGATLFRGYIKPETYRQEYERNRPVVTVDATDGIGLLRNVKFMDELDDYSILAGVQKVSEVLAYLLWKAGNTMNWRDCINYSLAGHLSDNLLRHQEIPVWKYHDRTCYDVLTDVLSIFNVQLVQVGGVFHVRLADQPYAEEVDMYTHKGIYSSSFTIPRDVLHLDNYKGLQGDVRMERPVRQVNFKAPQMAIPDMIFNGDFKQLTDYKPNKPYGWEGWGDIPSTNYYVEEGELILKGKPYGTTADYGVRNNISRGVRTTGGHGVRVGVSMQARKDSSTSSNTILRFNLQPAVGWPFQVDSSDWKTYTLEGDGITIPENEEDIYLYINSPESTTIHIKDVKVWPIQYTDRGRKVEDIDNDSKASINSKSQQDITHEIKYAWGGNPYRFENAFPNLPGKLSHVYNRINGLANTPGAIQKARALEFYGSARMRVGFSVYKDEAPIRIDDILYDKHYARSYVVTSLQYDLSAAKYSVEALEHKRMYIDPDPDNWILAYGIWNDDGYWVDAEHWNDTDPN